MGFFIRSNIFTELFQKLNELGIQISESDMKNISIFLAEKKLKNDLLEGEKDTDNSFFREIENFIFNSNGWGNDQFPEALKTSILQNYFRDESISYFRRDAVTNITRFLIKSNLNDDEFVEIIKKIMSGGAFSRGYESFLVCILRNKHCSKNIVDYIYNFSKVPLTIPQKSPQIEVYRESGIPIFREDFFSSFAKNKLTSSEILDDMAIRKNFVSHSTFRILLVKNPNTTSNVLDKIFLKEKFLKAENDCVSFFLDSSNNINISEPALANILKRYKGKSNLKFKEVHDRFEGNKNIQMFLIRNMNLFKQ